MEDMDTLHSTGCHSRRQRLRGWTPQSQTRRSRQRSSRTLGRQRHPPSQHCHPGSTSIRWQGPNTAGPGRAWHQNSSPRQPCIPRTD